MPVNCTHPIISALTVAALLLIPIIGCKAAPPSAVPAQAAQPGVAGISYDPSAPLDVTVTSLGGQGVRSYNVRFRGANGGFVPGLLTLPAPVAGKKAPCVLLLHGLGGSKGNMFLLGLSLARRGYATFAIDIAGHGERARINNRPSNDLALLDMRLAAAQTVIDLRRATDFLATRPDIDSRRIGFIGISLGGILGAVFVAEEPRVRAATLWSAGGDWGRLVTTSTHQFARTFRARGATDARVVEAQMADVDPVFTIARFAPRPLLMINGASDTVVPRASAQALYAAARTPKRQIILPGGHVPDISQMVERTLAWLDRSL